MQEIASKHPQVKYIRQEKRGGIDADMAGRSLLPAAIIAGSSAAMT